MSAPIPVPIPTELLGLVPHLRIAHQIPGRIRLKCDAELDSGLLDLLPGLRRFNDVLDAMPAIRSVKPNLLAHSCTIEYNAKLIPDSAWPDLLGGQMSEAAKCLAALLEAAYRELAHA